MFARAGGPRMEVRCFHGPARVRHVIQPPFFEQQATWGTEEGQRGNGGGEGRWRDVAVAQPSCRLPEQLIFNRMELV
jgi:hypothetical protein